MAVEVNCNNHAESVAENTLSQKSIYIFTVETQCSSRQFPLACCSVAVMKLRLLLSTQNQIAIGFQELVLGFFQKTEIQVMFGMALIEPPKTCSPTYQAEIGTIEQAHIIRWV